MKICDRRLKSRSFTVIRSLDTILSDLEGTLQFPFKINPNSSTLKNYRNPVLKLVKHLKNASYTVIQSFNNYSTNLERTL